MFFNFHIIPTEPVRNRTVDSNSKSSLGCNIHKGTHSIWDRGIMMISLQNEFPKKKIVIVMIKLESSLIFLYDQTYRTHLAHLKVSDNGEYNIC